MNRSALVCLGFVLIVGTCQQEAQSQSRSAPSPAPRVQQVGASVPFTSYEAENAVVGGNAGAFRLTTLPTPQTSNPEIEASGRGHVRLNPGGWVEFRNVRRANAMVLRHSIPDAANGGGQTGTVNMYVNGVLRQTLTLSSKYNWLYGEAGDNGMSNNPADGSPHVYWDDARFLITGGLNAGDRVRFQVESNAPAGFYCRIDVLDLETASPPLSPPKAGTYLSVTDFGANGNDAASDTTAIRNCINAAKAQGKIVWIPAGTYYQTSKWTLDGVKVQGAGYWHTRIIGINPSTNFAGNLGFVLTGNGSGVSDLYIESTVDTARDIDGSKPFTGVYGVTENWSVKNVWITHVNVAFWMSGADHGTVNGCRVYFTYADAINVNRGASHNLVVNNYVRGAGDDGIVSLSEVQNGSVVNQIATGNTFRYNTIIANWWGHNAAIGGGGGHVYEYNHLADNSHTGVLSINLPHAFPKNPLTSCTVRGNLLIRGGSNFASQRRGALWINADYTTANASFIDNTILDPIFRGIHVVGEKNQNITFTRTIIERPGQDAVKIDGEAKGSGTFINTTIRGLKPGFDAFDNDGGSDYVLTQTGTVVE